MLFIKPCTGRITSHFNLKRKHPITGKITPHWGTDFGNHNDNTIVAAQSGTIRIASHSNTGFGNYVIITHSNGWETVYAHLKSIAVKVGQKVKKGQYIGVKGTTGNSTGVHLHFEISKGRWTNSYSKHVNPVGYIDNSSIALFRGIVGPRVGNLQSKLNSIGYKLTVDNSFGPAVEKAVKDFQKKNKLTVDGSVGPATFEKLGKINIEKPSIGKSITQMAQEIIAGKHGTGHENRRKSLGISKGDYEKVREVVNQLTNVSKSVQRMADEVIAGKHGAGHAQRRKSLQVSAETYAKVRAEVNCRLR